MNWLTSLITTMQHPVYWHYLTLRDPHRSRRRLPFETELEVESSDGFWPRLQKGMISALRETFGPEGRDS